MAKACDYSVLLTTSYSWTQAAVSCNCLCMTIFVFCAPMYHLSVYCTLLYSKTAFFFLCGVFPQVSSSSSTLSLLFGKRSFSSGLVISGLSAAEGGNTTDTQSSSSVNIAIGPSHRSSSRATQVGNKSKGAF